MMEVQIKTFKCSSKRPMLNITNMILRQTDHNIIDTEFDELNINYNY